MNELDKEILTQEYENDVIDMKAIFLIFWTERMPIISITSIFATCSIIISLMMTDYFRANALLSPVSSQNSTLSQYSGLASLAGVTLPGSSNVDSVTEIIEIIKSREFVKHIITFDFVLPSLMAAESFNPNTNEIIFDKNIYNPETGHWMDMKGDSHNKAPSYLEVHKIYLKEILNISQDRRSGLVSISVEHISPVFAKELLELIIKEANQIQRDKDIKTANMALNYLNQELAQTSLASLKQTINLLIENQLENKMMASINQEYTLVTIEPPYIPEEKSKPVRSLIVILATLFGGILSLVYVLIRHYISAK